MKTRHRSMAVGVGLVAIGLAVSTVWAKGGAEDGIGIFTAVQGQVTVAHPKVATMIPVKLQDDVLFKDIIETQNKSRTKALFEDDSLLTVGENSRIEITEHIYDPAQNKRSMVVRLVQGRLRALVSKIFTGSGSKFEIHTPTAVAAARGTYFVVWFENGISGVVNIGTSGRVDFTSNGHTVSLMPGDFSFAPSGAVPTGPTPFSMGLGLGPLQRAQQAEEKIEKTLEKAETKIEKTLEKAETKIEKTAVEDTPNAAEKISRTVEQAVAKIERTGEQAIQKIAKTAEKLVDQPGNILASVNLAVEGTELKDTPKPETPKAAVRAVLGERRLTPPVSGQSSNTPGQSGTTPGGLIAVSPPAVISGAAGDAAEKAAEKAAKEAEKGAEKAAKEAEKEAKKADKKGGVMGSGIMEVLTPPPVISGGVPAGVRGAMPPGVPPGSVTGGLVGGGR